MPESTLDTLLTEMREAEVEASRREVARLREQVARLTPPETTNHE